MSFIYFYLSNFHHFQNCRQINLPSKNLDPGKSLAQCNMKKNSIDSIYPKPTIISNCHSFQHIPEKLGGPHS